MVEFKVVVNDIKSGKSYNIPVSGHHANSLIAKKINDEVDGIFVSLPGYKLQITGGTDKDGFPMRHDIPGPARRRLLLSRGLGLKPEERGKRKKKSIRGNGLPWFDYYADGLSVVPGSGILQQLKSVVQLGKQKGDAPLPENEPVRATPVVVLRKGLKQGQVREGRF